MKTFQINENTIVVCDWKKTRSAFKHEATLMRNGLEVDTTKICYSNRTWEAYEYQDVAHKIIDNNYTGEEATDYKNRIDAIGNGEADRVFSGIAMIAQMGDIFHAGDPEASNDWKVRMLQAGLPENSIIMPEDWDTLPEDEKTRRLDGAIETITK
jgi:hypothetical protein